MKTDEDSHYGVTTETATKSRSQVHVRAVQQRVPVRVAVLSNSTAATAGQNDAATSHKKILQEIAPVWKYRTGQLVHRPQRITVFTTCRRDWKEMVDGRGKQSRSPVLSPWVAGGRQPSDPSRRTQPRVPPTRGF